MAPAPAVSVLVPTHQRRERVLQAVASVLSQTMADLELIVVDDGSTDGTGEALGRPDPRLRYVWQEQAGVAAARNAAAALSRAPVLAFIDSDNLWLPDHLSVLTTVLELHPDAVLASTCPGFLTVGREPPGRARSGDLLPELLMAPTAVGFTSCCAIRREAFEAVDGFDEGLSVYEDFDLFLRLAMVGDVARVRRRTVQRRRSEHGLKQSGRRAGAYITAAAHSAATMQSALARHRPAAPPAVVRSARARVHWAEAEAALEAGDSPALAAALARACELQPEISWRPTYGAFRIRGHLTRSHEPGEHLRAALDLAEAWPHPHADTPRYLRCQALLLAVRTVSPRQARRALSGFGARGLPGFALRVLPVFAYSMRCQVQIHRDSNLA